MPEEPRYATLTSTLLDDTLQDEDDPSVPKDSTVQMLAASPRPHIALSSHSSRCGLCLVSKVQDQNEQLVSYSTDEVVRLGGIVARYVSRVSMNQVLLTWALSGILWVLAVSPAVKWDITAKGISSITAQAGELTNLVIFLLGLFTSLTLSRWWTVRTSLTRLHGALASISMIVASSMSPGAEHAVAQGELQRHVIRLAQLVHRLVFVEARVQCPMKGHGQPLEEFVAELQQEGLLTEREAEALRERDGQRVACTALMWMQQEINTAVDAGVLLDAPAQPLWYISSAILVASSSIDIVRAHIEAQLPLPYVHIISFMTKANMLVITTETGISVGFAIRHNLHFFGITELMYMVMLPLGFQALLDLHRKLRNPLDQASTSFPMRHLQSLIKSECEGMFVRNPGFRSKNQARDEKEISDMGDTVLTMNATTGGD